MMDDAADALLEEIRKDDTPTKTPSPPSKLKGSEVLYSGTIPSKDDDDDEEEDVTPSKEDGGDDTAPSKEEDDDEDSVHDEIERLNKSAENLQQELEEAQTKVDEQVGLVSLPQPNGGAAVQFVGQVGKGARSLRGDQPLLPRHKFNLEKGDKKSVLGKFKPRRKSQNEATHSYFEVEILPRPNEVDDKDEEQSSDHDCVAVGLSSRHFSIDSEMPGWDGHSYGYHGDNGAIYHGSGAIVRQFGPKFGVGDTVGCGVDYVKKGIFYTLNGKLLGYAWKSIPTADLIELYPTVGLDTNCPVQCNYGERPFMYEADGE